MTIQEIKAATYTAKGDNIIVNNKQMPVLRDTREIPALISHYTDDTPFLMSSDGAQGIVDELDSLKGHPYFYYLADCVFSKVLEYGTATD